MIDKLLTKHYLEFLSLKIKGGCRGSSESTLVKMSNSWKSHAAAQILMSALSYLFMEFGSLYCKQYGLRSVCSQGNSLIRAHSVCFHDNNKNKKNRSCCVAVDKPLALETRVWSPASPVCQMRLSCGLVSNMQRTKFSGQKY